MAAAVVACTVACMVAYVGSKHTLKQIKHTEHDMKNPTREHIEHDIVVYGATPAGIMAAVSASRMNYSVVLLAESTHIGGMMSGGLSRTDIIRPGEINNSLLVGGVAKEFFDLNTKWYGETGPTIYDVEPHVARTIFERMLIAENVSVVLNAPVDKVSKRRTSKNLTVIKSIRDDQGREFVAAMFIDASYEGDLLAGAGVSYSLGREAAVEYNESLAGFTGGGNPQFDTYVNPYSDQTWELLPLVDSLPPGLGVGDADTVVSSYTFRLCVTNEPDNRVPFERPAVYNASDWELFRRWSHGHAVWGTRPYYKRKVDLNSGGAIGTDFVGAMHDYLPAAAWAEANRTTRAMMWQQHKDYVQGLLWFKGNDPSIEAAQRKLVMSFGLCKDEFPESGHWPPQLYIRESRRMRGQRVVIQRDVVSAKDIGVEAVGIGGYVFDTHTARRYACTPRSPPNRKLQCTAPTGGGSAPPSVQGYAWDESHMVSDPGLFQLPRSLLLPRRSEATNLAVPTAVSASHVVFSCLRMEPQWMVLGQAAGVLAALALTGNATHKSTAAAMPVQDVSAARLNAMLRRQGAMLDLPNLTQSSSCVLNRCVPHSMTGIHETQTKQRRCQFCQWLAPEEWLAPVDDFILADPTSANITSVRPTTLRKSLQPDVATDLPVPTGYSCGLNYLQHYRGVWICTV